MKDYTNDELFKIVRTPTLSDEASDLPIISVDGDYHKRLKDRINILKANYLFAQRVERAMYGPMKNLPLLINDKSVTVRNAVAFRMKRGR